MKLLKLLAIVFVFSACVMGEQDEEKLEDAAPSGKCDLKNMDCIEIIGDG